MAKGYFPILRRIGSGIVSLWRNPRLLGAPFVRMGRWAVRVAPKVGFGLLVLFVLAAIPWTYFNIKYGRELEAELGRIKAAGQPVTMSEVAPDPVPNEQNAAVLYERVFNVGHYWREEPPRPRGGKRRIGFNDVDVKRREALESYVEGQRGRAEELTREALELPRVQERLEILRAGSRREHAAFPVNWEDGAGALLPQLARYREAARWLTAKMLASAGDGDVDGALLWCKVALRMSQHAASEPDLISQLVAVVMQGGTIDMRQSFLNAMRGERAFGAWIFDKIPGRPRLIQSLTDGQDSWLELLWFRVYASAIGSPWRRFDRLAHLDYMAQLIEANHEPYRVARMQLTALAQKAENACKLGALSPVLCPVFSRATAKRDWAIARLDEFRIVLALKVYKQEHGAYPKTLDELQMTLSWELPKDVFSGEAFRYQRKGEGFMLYSFGRDLDDDGGVREEDRKYEDGDIVWECAK